MSLGPAIAEWIDARPFRAAPLAAIVDRFAPHTRAQVLHGLERALDAGVLQRARRRGWYQRTNALLTTFVERKRGQAIGNTLIGTPAEEAMKARSAEERWAFLMGELRFEDAPHRSLGQLRAMRGDPLGMSILGCPTAMLSQGSGYGW